jgi:hypothetical protein
MPISSSQEHCCTNMPSQKLGFLCSHLASFLFEMASTADHWCQRKIHHFFDHPLRNHGDTFDTSTSNNYGPSMGVHYRGVLF